MCSADARPGAPGRIDCRIFPDASGFTPEAPYPGHTATCASGSEYLPSLEAATRIFTQLGELLRRARRRRLRSKKHCAVEGGKRVYANHPLTEVRICESSFDRGLPRKK